MNNVAFAYISCGLSEIRCEDWTWTANHADWRYGLYLLQRPLFSPSNISRTGSGRHSLTGEAYIRGVMFRKYPVRSSKKIEKPFGHKICRYHDVFTLASPVERKPRPKIKDLHNTFLSYIA
jgi:hypothetical protein